MDNAEFDPVITLYSGDCGEGSPLYCVPGTSVSVPPQAGGTYFLVIDGAGEKAWGSYDLTVTLN